jgi:hypothetical protein
MCIKSTPSIIEQQINKEDFNIVALYDDLPAGKRARGTCGCLLDPLSGESVNYEMWNFGVLRIPEIQDQATRNATEADLIIVATSEEKPFAPHVREWFDRWVASKSPERNGALLALCHSPSTSPNSQCAYLREIARRADFQFFTKTT